jgi:F420-dependent oxidoreductase-like protein
MKLAINTMGPTANFGLWGAGMSATLNIVQLAEDLGFDSVWTAEASGTDAVVPLSWIAGATSRIKLGTSILQMTAREPSMTAMTAVTLDNLSNGRLILGLGSSGPGIVEGWHSRAYSDPIDRSREYVDIVRRLITRRKPVSYHGDYYNLPFRGDGSHRARPVQLMVRAKRRDIPIYLAAMGPRNLELAADVADGVIFPMYSPFRDEAVFGDLRPKFGKGGIEVASFVPVAIGPDVKACIDMLRPVIAFWLGGMGSGKINFYNQYARRMGFDEASEVQTAYGSGRRNAAAAAVPEQFIDEVSLCGPPSRVAERLEAWQSSAATTMILTGVLPDGMEMLAELCHTRSTGEVVRANGSPVTASLAVE